MASMATGPPRTSPSPPGSALARRPPAEHLADRVGLKVQNVVATCNLGARMELRQIATSIRNAEYTPKRFPAAILRLRKPHRATALIYGSGKMVVLGCKSHDDARRAAQYFAKLIQKIDQPANMREFKVQNMVGTCDMGFPIRLEKLVYTHAKFASYEPELFPGLIYRMQAPKMVILAFVSGKFVVTGAKNIEDMRKAVEKIHPVLLECRKEESQPLPGAAGARAT
mmetsp:Transcript_41503/g.129933  ORF Transcript_41503/g.129933 Transcript_41503/m.129933 type:complete len:226 (-) Transcript_41503:225-902(-)